MNLTVEAPKGLVTDVRCPMGMSLSCLVILPNNHERLNMLQDTAIDVAKGVNCRRRAVTLEP